jgi:methylase of polypeptide subunit release factors
MSPDYRLSQALRQLEAMAARENEATLRGEFVEALNRFLESRQLREQGVRVLSENRLIRGITDARVGGIVFEVKLPLPRGSGIERAIEQCQGYVREFPERYGGKPARGVAYDGRELALIGEDGNVFHRGMAPSMARELEAWLVALGGAIISPEDFVERLGPGSEVAGQMLGELWAIFGQFSDSVGIIDEAFQVWRGLYKSATNVDEEARRNLRRTAASLGITVADNQQDTERYLFVIETYLSLLLRLLLMRASVQTHLTLFGSVIALLRQAGHPALSLRDAHNNIPGVTGIFEEDVFLWPVEASIRSSSAEESFESALLDMATTVDEVDLIGVSQDFLRLVYQRFFDPVTRRALGEFYTKPDIVDETLDAVGYDGSSDKRLGDITCGSGTFLIRAISRVRNRSITPNQTLSSITNNIIGVDIHPFAVAMARVNYILAIADMINPQNPVHIPIYWADSLLRLAPVMSRVTGSSSGRGHGALSTPGIRPVVTVTIPGLGEFLLPDHRDVRWGDLLDRVGQTLSRFRPPIPIDAAKERFWEGMTADNYLAYEDTINNFITQIIERHNRNRDMRWLPLLRNALSLDEMRLSCDFIVGNPPWVRVHNIAPEIRQRLFREYETFVNAGWKRGAAVGGIGRGFGRQVDYSVAFVERAQEFLKPGGRLGFVITSKVIHALYGNAMRKKLLRETSLLTLNDYSLHVRTLFEDATNYPLILTLEKTPPTPDHEVIIHVAGPNNDDKTWSSQQIELPLISPALDATPLGQADESPWVLVSNEVIKAFRKMQAEASPDGRMRLRRLLGEIRNYQSGRGILTELNDTFIVKRIEPTDNPNELMVYTEGYYNQRIPDEIRLTYRARIEKSLLRPLVRGENITAWNYETKDYVIWTHDDITGQPMLELPQRAREYFARHEAALRRRSDFRDNMPIWQIFRVSKGKLGNKVAWQELSNTLGTVFIPATTASVSQAAKLIIPLQTAYLIPVPSQAVGLVLSCLLNSNPVRAFATSFAERARGAYFRYFSWVIGLIPIPIVVQNFLEQPNETSSQEISRLLSFAHRLQQLPNNERGEVEQLINVAVAGLYELDGRDIASINEYLNFIKPATDAQSSNEEQGEEE